MNLDYQEFRESQTDALPSRKTATGIVGTKTPASSSTVENESAHDTAVAALAELIGQLRADATRAAREKKRRQEKHQLVRIGVTPHPLPLTPVYRLRNNAARCDGKSGAHRKKQRQHQQKHSSPKWQQRGTKKSPHNTKAIAPPVQKSKTKAKLPTGVRNGLSSLASQATSLPVTGLKRKKSPGNGGKKTRLLNSAARKGASATT